MSYSNEIVAFINETADILCPYCAHRNYNSLAVYLAEQGKKNSEGLFGLTRQTLTEFMVDKFKDNEFYENAEFYPCDICGGEIE